MINSLSIRGVYMYLYDLDSKISNKSYEILNSHIEQTKELSASRINEIRMKCRDILAQNGIFEDRKNGNVYLALERELNKLENNIDYYNEYLLDEITKNKIDLNIENISQKIDSLEQKFEFVFEKENVTINKANSEHKIRSMLFTFFENYKNTTLDMLSKAGYSQNTTDKIEEDILEFVTSKASDVFTEKFYTDRIKVMQDLTQGLDELSVKIVDEAEARYTCELNGQVFDELKDKRDSVRQKAELLESIRAQIYSLDLKTEELTGNSAPIQTGDRILL